MCLIKCLGFRLNVGPEFRESVMISKDTNEACYNSTQLHFNPKWGLEIVK
jgi:hypothetical protein